MNLFGISSKLTNRDLDVMEVLWNSKRSMTASEIVAFNPKLNKNTVQPSLRKLLKNELIQVADIVYSGTVLSRSYIPTVSKQELLLYRLTDNYRKLEKDVSKASLFSFLLKTEGDKKKVQSDVEQMEKILNEYKSKLLD